MNVDFAVHSCFEYFIRGRFNFSGKIVHSVAPLYEKYFCLKADLRRGTAKSVLILRSSLLLEMDSLTNISVR